jgi:hypothetical protein
MGQLGGKRPGAGRKSKAHELQLTEKLQPMEGDFLKKLREGVKKGNPIAMKMFAEYFYGKPKERVALEITDLVIDTSLDV